MQPLPCACYGNIKDVNISLLFLVNIFHGVMSLKLLSNSWNLPKYNLGLFQGNPDTYSAENGILNDVGK